ncbi:MAG: 7-cyano-7-deazaguanine synthase [Candidatus Bathyarchaeota archaeon]|nr:7-cyano-7-deazaguanine synthase [Candidatus Bathyarchaeota archaeon]
MKKVKALAMFSGGLDSTLAIKVMLEQGIEVEALSFTTPFCLCEGKGGCVISKAARKLDIPLKKISIEQDYFEIVKNPKYGYGKYMNPCVDCRIYMLKKAKKYAEIIGAQFIITGEVLGQRPMSQRRKTLEIIEKEAGLVNKIIRPLSDKHFSETEAELKGLVEKTKLFDIRGRSRKKQMELAKKFEINEYPCPSGGCLLTYKEFAAKVKDILKYDDILDFKVIALLKIGRHFRYGKNKIIVGRNEEENSLLLSLKGEADNWFEAIGYGSPITLLQGPKTEDAIRMAACVTAKYSDCGGPLVNVKYEGKTKNGTFFVEPIVDELLYKIRIS